MMHVQCAWIDCPMCLATYRGRSPTPTELATTTLVWSASGTRQCSKTSPSSNEPPPAKNITSRPRSRVFFFVSDSRRSLLKSEDHRDVSLQPCTFMEHETWDMRVKSSHMASTEFSAFSAASLYTTTDSLFAPKQINMYIQRKTNMIRIRRSLEWHKPSRSLLVIIANDVLLIR